MATLERKSSLKRCLSQRHNGQHLPPLVHTDWRLSESAACLKPAHYCRRAGRLEAWKKNMHTRYLLVTLNFPGHFLWPFLDRYFARTLQLLSVSQPCSEAALTTLKSTRMWDLDARCVCVCGHTETVQRRPGPALSFSNPTILREEHENDFTNTSQHQSDWLAANDPHSLLLIILITYFSGKTFNNQSNENSVTMQRWSEASKNIKSAQTAGPRSIDLLTFSTDDLHLWSVV